jgi:2,3-bisphosphoglycerate-dependent phosphoglycerate mutase
MSIFLIRHGETALNVARVLQPADTPLSERGRRQAHALAKRFETATFGALISSDLPRALETARAIAMVTRKEIQPSALLQERNFGRLRGTAYDTLNHDAIAMEEAPPDGESMAAVRERARQAMNYLRSTHAELGGDLVVISHGLFIRTMLAENVEMPDGNPVPRRIDNTGITIFSGDSPHRATVVNDTEHLTGDLRDDAVSLSGA